MNTLTALDTNMQIAERINNPLNAVPKTNMEVVEQINQQPISQSPYFSLDIHNYLMEKGADFKKLDNHNVEYRYTVNGEDARLLFLNSGVVKIQVWWEEDEVDGETAQSAGWLTDNTFTVPVGPDCLVKFKQILNAYIEEL